MSIPGKSQQRQFLSLGAADDYSDADGVTTLTFAQAQDRAAEFFAECLGNEGKKLEPTTVSRAAEIYMKAYRARGGKAETDTQRTIDAHILPSLGDRFISALSATIISKWRDGLATAPARLRAGPNTTERKFRPAVDSDAKRARRATANRIFTVLKAILNHAFANGLITSDNAWRRVKPFPRVDAPKIRYLTEKEIKRLVNTCPQDFRKIVTAALLTGCRYGELCNLVVQDVDLPARLAHVREAKGGKPRTVNLTAEGVELLKQLTVGRNREDFVLKRDDGEQWGKSHQSRRIEEACTNASISPSINFHILRHTFASRLAMAGVPMAVIANALGNSEAICAKHYAHLCPSYAADRMREGFGKLGIVEKESKVSAIR